MATKFTTIEQAITALADGYNYNGRRWTLRRIGSYELRSKRPHSDSYTTLLLDASVGDVLAGRWPAGKYEGDFRGSVPTDTVVVRLGGDAAAMRQRLEAERDERARTARTARAVAQAQALLATLQEGPVNLPAEAVAELRLLLGAVAA
jgi:hypothetical protein